jgi:hypothetical protein
MLERIRIKFLKKKKKKKFWVIDLPLDLNFWGLLGEMVSNGRKGSEYFFIQPNILKQSWEQEKITET